MLLGKKFQNTTTVGLDEGGLISNQREISCSSFTIHNFKYFLSWPK
jgi:hypothetical protein